MKKVCHKKKYEIKSRLIEISSGEYGEGIGMKYRIFIDTKREIIITVFEDYYVESTFDDIAEDAGDCITRCFELRREK